MTAPRMRLSWRGVLAPSLLVLAGCVTTGAGAPNPSWEPVSSEEIRRSSASNAFDLVHQVRPNWLRGRGITSMRNREPEVPVVYLGPVRQGTVEVLRAFPTNGLVELRYMDGTSATTRYGDGHGAGVIQVVVRSPEGN